MVGAFLGEEKYTWLSWEGSSLLDYVPAESQVGRDLCWFVGVELIFSIVASVRLGFSEGNCQKLL